MFKPFIPARLLVVSGAIALSLVSPSSPAFSKLDCRGRDTPPNYSQDLTTRTLKLEKFGLQVKIPAKYRALLYNNGIVEILPPEDFRIRQCTAQGQPVGTEVLPFLRFQLYPNPKNLKAHEFAQQFPQRYKSPLQQRRVNHIDLSMQETAVGYELFYGWYQPPGVQGIVQVTSSRRNVLYDTIEQAKLIGGEGNTIDSILQSAFDRISNPDAGASKVTISRENDSAESPTKSTLTITKTGYLDDSVRGHKTIIQMKKLSDGRWTVTDKQKLTICQPGRGSQTGSTKLCI